MIYKEIVEELGRTLSMRTLMPIIPSRKAKPPGVPQTKTSLEEPDSLNSKR